MSLNHIVILLRSVSAEHPSLGLRVEEHNGSVIARQLGSGWHENIDPKLRRPYAEAYQNCSTYQSQC